MPRILIVESNPPELLAKGHSGARLFLRTFQRIAPDVDLLVTCPYARAFGPDLLDGIDGVVFTGSSTDWATDAREAAPMREAMQVVFGQSLPSWGSCNGLQLASVVLGGSVRASPNGYEVGLASDIDLAPGAFDHPMMAGRTPGFSVPCHHRDEVQDMPAGAVLLASNAHSTVQAMVYERDGVDFWGVQYHPEMNLTDVAPNVGKWLDAATIADIAAAEQDAEAAERLGTSPRAQQDDIRARELINWVAHVRARRGSGLEREAG